MSVKINICWFWHVTLTLLNVAQRSPTNETIHIYWCMYRSMFHFCSKSPPDPKRWRQFDLRFPIVVCRLVWGLVTPRDISACHSSFWATFSANTNRFLFGASESLRNGREGGGGVNKCRAIDKMMGTRIMLEYTIFYCTIGLHNRYWVYISYRPLSQATPIGLVSVRSARQGLRYTSIWRVGGWLGAALLGRLLEHMITNRENRVIQVYRWDIKFKMYFRQLSQATHFILVRLVGDGAPGLRDTWK